VKDEPSSFWHYRETGFVSHRSRLSDEEFGKLLDNCVVACVDVVVVAGEEMFLGRRREEPAKDQWWTCGGKMDPGESGEEAAWRIVERELGLNSRNAGWLFRLPFTPSFVWRRRAQEPVDHGCHMMSLYYMLLLKSGGYKHLVTLSSDDFTDSRWVSIKEVADGVLVDMELHGAIRQAAMCVCRAVGIPKGWGPSIMRWFARLCEGFVGGR
jgi:ADP-ribose pyrophosphatase YjhB (NUDIX family)